jgi:putative NADH-flavin reductase
MNVTVFGATGAIGRLAVAESLRLGHVVTAHARNATKMPAGWSGVVDVVLGEVTDAASVDRAIAGADAVVSTLGPSMDRSATGLPLVEANRNIVAAMHAHGVHRFVGNGTPSFLDVRDRRTFQPRVSALIARTFLRRGYDEMIGMSRVIAESELDWTIVRFLAPTDGAPTGVVRSGFYGRDRLGWRTTRGDIAAFTVAQLTSDAYVRAAPGISN